MTCANHRLLLACGLVLVLAANLTAQVSESRPVKVKTPKPTKEKFVGEVLSVTRGAITVRSRENTTLVRTFTYDNQKLADKMAKMIDRNQPFQHGDRVEIQFLAGTDKAVKIKGKPSPSH